MKSLKIFLGIVLACTSNFVHSQVSLPRFITDSIDMYVNRSLAVEKLPGLAVAVVKDGKVVFIKGYGVKEWGGSDPVDENTLFMIGSNSKAFTSVSLAMLEMEGKLSLNDPVTKWIPDFALDNEMAGKMATVRDLLCHRIGFGTFQGDFTYWKSDLTRDDVIHRMSKVKALYPFRTKYGYCNAGFLTAGEIIPRVTGIKWEDFIKQRIFDPLGMDRTLALTQSMPAAENKTYPHDLVNGKVIQVPYCMIDDLAPAASICSSVNDMSKWMIMLLNKGVFNGNRIVPERAINEVWFPHTIIGNGGTPFNKGHFSLYGLGFSIREYEGHTIISHGGAVTGYLSTVTMIPDLNLGIVILTNSIRNSVYSALANEITDAFLNLPYRNYQKFYYSRTSQNLQESWATNKIYEDSVAMKIKPALSLDRYTGNYNNELYGDLKVVIENQQLHMKFSHHHFDVVLNPLGGNRFYAVFSDPEFETAVFPFTVENGKVKSVLVKVADFIEYTPYIFERTGDL